MASKKTVTKTPKAQVVAQSNNKTTKPLKWIEIEKTLDYLEKKEKWHELLIIAVGCYTGFRINELLILTYLDFEGEEINMIVSKQNKKDKRGKGKKDIIRTVPIYSKVKDIVELCRTKLNKKKDTPLIVNSRYYSETPLTRMAALTRIVNAFSLAGIERKMLSAHSLRKTYALRKYEVYKKKYGDYAALNKVRKDLRHKSVSATREYIGIPESDEKELDEIAFN